MFDLNKDKLIRGDGYQINHYLNVKQPTVSEIIDLGEKYSQYCQYFSFNTEDFIIKLHDLGLRYYEFTSYDIFIKQFESEIIIKNNPEKFNIDNDYVFLDESLNWWFQNDYNFKLINHVDTKKPILYDKSNGIIFDMFSFDKMSYFIKLINYQPLKNKYEKPRESLYNKLVEKRRKKLERLKKKKNQSTNYLHDCILSISCASNTIDLFNIWDLTIYQFYAQLRKIQRIEEVKNINIGIYTGNIDSKKNKIDTDWVKDVMYKNYNIGVFSK